MSKNLLHDITLHLDDVQFLFMDPEADSEMFVSGMDYLYSDIKTYSRHDKFKIKIVLPQEKITEGLVDRTREKMKRYCRFKIEGNQNELIALRHEGFNALRVGITVLVVCLVLATTLTLAAKSGINYILAALLAIVGQGFVIAGWVAMWQPAEILLYDWWPFRRDMRIYHQIADADIVILKES
jgi:hypothetical protein